MRFRHMIFGLLGGVLVGLPQAVSARTVAMPIGTDLVVVLDVPADCTLKTAVKNALYQCDFKTHRNPSKGEIRESSNISLAGNTMTLDQLLSEFAGVTRQNVQKKPYAYLSRILQLIEQSVTAPSEAGPGVRQIRADNGFIERGKTPRGVTACLKFNFDFEAPARSTKARFNSTGLRCMVFNPDADTVTILLLEYKSVDDHSKDRPPGFARDARPVIESLRLK
jgi:hypothetical protein